MSLSPLRTTLAATLALAVLISAAACRRSPDGAAPSPSPSSSAAAPGPAGATSGPDGATPTGGPDAAATEAAPAPMPRQPSLRVRTLDGPDFDLAAHRGDWVVVNFWATWCGPCLKEMPDLSALAAMRQHVKVIGLDYEDIAPKDLRAFLKKHPVTYPVAIVDVYDPPKDFATPRGLPNTYLIAPDGTVARQFLGPVTAADIEAAIAAAGGPPAGAG